MGFYLGGLSAFGAVLGLPLDIRHVSFASGNLGLILSATTPAWSALAIALLGIALIGLTNLAVSFGLALWMALRARGLGLRALFPVLGHLAERFRKDKQEAGVAPTQAA